MSDNIFSGKKIILGVTGGIAAYKSCLIVRELVKLGAEVRVVMTPSALQFITPLTLSSLSRNEVIVNVFPTSQENGTGVSTWHIDYALWADLMLIAPATVNTIAKIANGFADNALTTLTAALRCPLIIAPAADIDMYENKTTQRNISQLELLGHYIVRPEAGDLASGLQGAGRLAGIEKIIDAAELVLSGYRKDLTGKKILVTAGPTYEDIDPVRFIGNRSSGKMGFEIAKAAFLRGAEVMLITGPSAEIAYPEIKINKVRSAGEMKAAVSSELKKHDILIMSAAVADYRPENKAASKIKKEDNLTGIKLTENDDILASLDKKDKFIVGFALETDREKENALKKLKKKNLDIIVLNSLKEKESGFEFDTNKITVIHKNGREIEYPLQTKFQTSNSLLSEVLKSK